MKIVTTPMCKEILHLAGVSGFKISKNLDLTDFVDADVAIVLSEIETDENTSTQFIRLKLNTFHQIEESIKTISEILGTEPLNTQLSYILEGTSITRKNENRKIKVKVYSNFLREIVVDMGFAVVTGDVYDFLVYPDYLGEQLTKETHSAGESAIKLPSHKNAPSNPIKRAEIRYQILEKNLCMKH